MSFLLGCKSIATIREEKSMYRYLLSCIMLLSLASPSQAEIITEELTYKAGDTTMVGYLAYDNRNNVDRPGVLVVHEWWGHNAYARKRARMLAELGYTALALDMYGDGKKAMHPDDAQKFASEIAGNRELAKQRFMAALALLKKAPGTDAKHIAAIGYCFGGGVVLNMAREGIDLDAVVSFHGGLTTPTPAQPGKIKAKIMVAHGGADVFTKPEQLTGFIDEMNNAGAFYRLYIYSGAKHSFTNPDADEMGTKFKLPLQYNAAADRDSWQAMQVFLQQAFRE